MLYEFIQILKNLLFYIKKIFLKNVEKVLTNKIKDVIISYNL